jgi:hypothetical protein
MRSYTRIILAVLLRAWPGAFRNSRMFLDSTLIDLSTVQQSQNIAME